MVMILGYLAARAAGGHRDLGITSVYLEHKRLLSLADGAALAAADSYTLGEVAAQSGSPAALLDPGRVRSAAADFVASSPAVSASTAWLWRGRPAPGTDPRQWWSSPLPSTRPS